MKNGKKRVKIGKLGKIKRNKRNCREMGKLQQIKEKIVGRKIAKKDERRHKRKKENKQK